MSGGENVEVGGNSGCWEGTKKVGGVGAISSGIIGVNANPRGEGGDTIEVSGNAGGFEGTNEVGDAGVEVGGITGVNAN